MQINLTDGKLLVFYLPQAMIVLRGMYQTCFKEFIILHLRWSGSTRTSFLECRLAKVRFLVSSKADHEVQDLFMILEVSCFVTLLIHSQFCSCKSLMAGCVYPECSNSQKKPVNNWKKVIGHYLLLGVLYAWRGVAWLCIKVCTFSPWFLCTKMWVSAHL